MNARQRYDYTPMHFSAECGHSGIVKLLLERGAEIHAVNGHGQTPYQVSLAWGHRGVADLLREHGAATARSEEISLCLKCDV